MEEKAVLFRSLGGGKVECTACARRCRIPDGSRGFCFVRQNRNGELYLVNYGVMEAMQIDPIEKKPFNHFHPGSSVLGIGTSSCNFGCMFCQNHNISKVHEIKGVESTPERLVKVALDNGVDGIAYTYNEPTIFMEYALDVASVAKRHGLFNVFVSNGYMTGEAVDAMRGLIDAVVVDFKGNGAEGFANKFECIVSSDPIKEVLVRMKSIGIHVELTDLIIPAVGDSLVECDRLTRWIADSLGADTPIHFTRFYPDYKMLGYGPTPFETLKRHYDIAKGNGLEYVYIGNVPGNSCESTYCPKCGSVAIDRMGYYIKGFGIDDCGKCAKCGFRILMKGLKRGTVKNPNIISLY